MTSKKNKTFADRLKNVPLWAYLVLFLASAAGIGYATWFVAKPDPDVPRQSNLPTTGRVIEKQRQEDGFGWGSELLIDKQEGKAATIRFMLRDVDRKPVKNAKVSITFSHREKKEIEPRTARLEMVEAGVYRGVVDLPAGGRWEAHVAVLIDNTSYQVYKKLNLPEKEE